MDALSFGHLISSCIKKKKKKKDKFEKAIETDVFSVEHHAEWFRRFRKLGANFWHELEGCAPTFRVCSGATLQRALTAHGDDPRELRFAMSEFERMEERLVQWETSAKLAQASTSAVKALYDNASQKLATLSTLKETRRSRLGASFHTIGTTLEAIEANRGRELPLPGAASYRAFVAMARQHIELWKQPSIDFISLSSKLLEELVGRAIASIMGDHLQLAVRVQSAVDAEICSLTESCLQEVVRMLSEQEEPSVAFSTFNTDHLDKLVSEKTSELHKKKDEGIVDVNRLNEDQRQQLETLLNAMGTSIGHIRPHHDPSADTAISTMAMTYAYYTIACQRYADQVPKEVDSRIFRKFVKSIKATLSNKLKLMDGSANEAFALVAPDDSLLSKQPDIAARIVRQERALLLIDDFMKSCSIH